MDKRAMTAYRQPTWGGRIALAILLCVGVASSLGIPLMLEPFLANVSLGPVCDGLPALRWLVLAAILVFWIAGGLQARAAILTFRSGETPFPGALVWFRKPIRRGWRAKLDAAIFAMMAVVFVVGPVVAFFALEANVIFCWPEACGC